MIKSTVKPAAPKPAPKPSAKPSAKPSSANPAPTAPAKPPPKEAPAPPARAAVEQPPAKPVKDAASHLEAKVMKEKHDKDAAKLAKPAPDPAATNAHAPVKAPANGGAPPKPRVADAQSGPEDVVFAWTPEGADTVQIAGSFNDWKEKLVMKNVSGKHQLSIPLKPGKYFYKFIVDGEWCYDFTAPNETDDEGNVNNVITV